MFNPRQFVRHKTHQNLIDALIRGTKFLVPFMVALFVMQKLLHLVDSFMGAATTTLVLTILPDTWQRGPLQHGNIPGLDVVLLLIIIATIGTMLAWPPTHTLLTWTQKQIERIPGFKQIFSVMRKLFGSGNGETSSAILRLPVLFEHAGHLRRAFATHEIFIDDLPYVNLVIVAEPNPASWQTYQVATAAVLVVTNATTNSWITANFTMNTSLESSWETRAYCLGDV